MRFFYPPPPGFTHRARFYGIPCYVNLGDDTEIQGTNWLFDILISHACPHLHTCVNFFHALIYGGELPGFPIEVLEELPKDAARYVEIERPSQPSVYRLKPGDRIDRYGDSEIVVHADGTASCLHNGELYVNAKNEAMARRLIDAHGAGWRFPATVFLSEEGAA